MVKRTTMTRVIIEKDLVDVGGGSDGVLRWEILCKYFSTELKCFERINQYLIVLELCRNLALV